MSENNNNKKCYSCGKIFRTPANLAAHKNRKTPCLIREVSVDDLHNPLRCIYCNKVLSKKENLKRHLTTCKIKNGGMDILSEKVRYEQQIRILQEQVNQLQQQSSQDKKQITEELAELKSAQKALVLNNNGNNTINNNTTNNNTTNNTVNITLNHYMAPNIEHLNVVEANGHTVFYNLFRERLVQTPMALVPLIWFNPEIPENHTIYLKDKSRNEALVYDKPKWTTKQTNILSHQIREHTYQLTDNLAKTTGVDKTHPDIAYRLNINSRETDTCEVESLNITNELGDNRKLVLKTSPDILKLR